MLSLNPHWTRWPSPHQPLRSAPFRLLFQSVDPVTA